MGFKDILVHVDEFRGHETRIHIACDLAARDEAHLIGLFGIEPIRFGGMVTPVGADFAQIEAIEIIERQHRAERAAVAARLEAVFRHTADLAGIGCDWRTQEGEIAGLVTAQARLADIAIVGQADPEALQNGASVPEAVLLGAGRPVLVIPYVGHFETVGARALVAWNHTREAARAVNDALPLLSQAESVTVLAINPASGSAEADELATADVALHLARHGVKAEASYSVVEGIDVGDALLSRAADLGSDLIVMGGYGHSRLREVVMGGATRTILQHMTVPVLLSN
ncbi:MAG TPA: universal stress protein [Stellaceae bacterium]|nr:universal stress protein [Stellaceae bacterium]